MTKMTSLAGWLVFVFGFVSFGHAEDTRYVVIGTGGVTGVYYPTGGSICRLVNRDRAEHGVLCGVESTLGSVYNVKKIQDRELDLGVVQSDVQYRALMGLGEFDEKGPFKDLRSIFSIHSEPFTLIASKRSGIQGLEDLKGKRVNIGNPGSGQRATMDTLMHRLGWEQSVFSKVSELKSTDQSKGLCLDQFDAMIFTVGHPSGSIRNATSDCESVLVDVVGPVIDEMVAETPYFSAAMIPADMYQGNDKVIHTFGVSATLVASSETPDDIIYNVVKAIFEYFETFRALHPAFQGLQKEKMIKDALSAPIHNGAIKYYKEVGLM